MPGPLSGTRVVDLTHVLNGPFCTMLLAHMGAEVLKVEHGAGDLFRHIWMPPDVKRDGYEFLAVNSNKKGITLDLKQEQGKQIFRDLVKKSDVVVENFTTGVLDRLGLGYDTLKMINPRLIYACSRGYAESGPYKNVRANAATIAAISGWYASGMKLANMPGIKVPAFADEAAGVSMCLGIVAALYSRERSGEGQKIEVAMQESQLGFMVSLLHEHFESRDVGPSPARCADGYYVFHIPDMSDERWAQLAIALGKPELGRDPRFLTLSDRRKNYASMEAEVAALVRGKTRREIWTAMSGLGLASGPVLSVAEAFDDEHLKARGAVAEIEHPDAGKVKLLAPWIRFSSTPTAITAPAPLMGQHNREVYGGILGLSDEEIQALQRNKVIGP